MSQQELQQEEKVQSAEGSGAAHRMSIALTIGATIGAIGLILFLYGVLGNADYKQSAGININLWWGLVLVVFGLILGIGGFLSGRRSAAA
ncbi:hypothetical protein [Dictyobacter kobayashii]|uniref:Uncharacterized protein n=1 Tax=Dictyobacter kobayashii TaxID=2014872 RepID=A0A402AE99_9CHLR|nr:hypothetical protein [Dictyobacter kobayashii]GCE17382.1 hypothetical protein KDK_11820 [Dictyobacter kobayashii]